MKVFRDGTVGRRWWVAGPRGTRWGIVWVLGLLSLVIGTTPAQAQASPAAELATFKAWLDREHPGYGRDEGPARFRNPTVEAAYPGRRFYYVLTYTRGIPSPYRKPLSLVVHVDESGIVTPLNRASPATFRLGLRKVSTAQDARQAAAAVLILALADPRAKRWPFEEKRFAVTRSQTGWVCTYRHGGGNYTSQVTFDKHGVLSTFSANLPPVG